MGLRDLSIRKFRTEDAKAIARIINSNLPAANDNAEQEEITPKYILALSNKTKMYVALNDHTIVGTASIDHDSINMVFVDVQYKSQGIEGALLNLLEEIAANNGLKLIRLEAGSHAQKLYERLGYSFVSVIENSVFGKNIAMEKYLD